MYGIRAPKFFNTRKGRNADVIVRGRGVVGMKLLPGTGNMADSLVSWKCRQQKHGECTKLGCPCLCGHPEKQ